MKYLYKYPQAAYPYADLVETNRRRTRDEMEYELLDTGVFEEDRYFDVFVEYAKAGPEDILIQITAANRGPEAAELHVLPTLWFRNDWASWIARPAEKPMLKQVEGPAGTSAIAATHPVLGDVLPVLRRRCAAALHRERNQPRPARPRLPERGPVRQGRHQRLRGPGPPGRGEPRAARHQGRGALPAEGRPRPVGDGAAAPHRPAPRRQGQASDPFGPGFDETLAARLREADEFYRSVTPPSVSPDAANVMRQALAGMLWSKQYYYFDADTWLEEHRAHPLHHGSRDFRNREWFHMVNDDIISMPDKWEYPWYAAWDLAFHTLPLSIVDPDFAKEQMDLMLRGLYLHPSGQLPAYEWNFSDVNPPVHAWATLFLHRTEQALRGEADVDFLKSAFNKLLLNFTWWVNRKDRFGKNVFEGGFLGLDNIGVFDRSAPLPTGGYLEQADGTAWMALFTQNMLELAVELAGHDRTYEDMVFKFVEHFLYIAAAMNKSGPDGMWDEEDGFYYDLLRLPDGSAHAAQGALDGGAAAAVRHDGDREVAARARSAGNGRASGARAPDAGAPGVHPPHGSRSPGGGRAGHLRPGQPGAAAPDPLQDAGRERVPEPLRHPLALQVPRAAPVRLPRGRPGVPGGLPAGRIEHRHVRRQLQLAGSGLDAGQRPDSSGRS